MSHDAFSDCPTKQETNSQPFYEKPRPHSAEADARLEYAEKWAEKRTKKDEMVKVKDLQHTRTLDTEWLGYFRVNWYVEIKTEDERLMSTANWQMKKSHFIHVKRTGDRYVASICDVS